MELTKTKMIDILRSSAMEHTYDAQHLAEDFGDDENSEAQQDMADMLDEIANFIEKMVDDSMIEKYNIRIRLFGS